MYEVATSRFIESITEDQSKMGAKLILNDEHPMYDYDFNFISEMRQKVFEINKETPRMLSSCINSDYYGKGNTTVIYITSEESIDAYDEVFSPVGSI